MSFRFFNQINSGCRALCAAFVLGALVMAGSVSAATCRVTVTGAGSNDGATWGSAMTLQMALASASSCDEVWVQAGTYTPTTGNSRSASFSILPAVQVYGGFAGSETQRSARDSGANLTTLSGDIGTSGDNSDNSYHVMFMDGTQGTTITGNTVLDGFTISGGNANGASNPNDAGGGLYCDGRGSGHECSPSLSNVTFSGNSAEYGGAMLNDGDNGTSSPSLSNVTFSGNSANQGGAMFNYGYKGTSSPSLSNVTFSGNSANYGGAMVNDGSSGTSSPSVSNVTFSGNSANYGGAMYNDGYNGTSSPSLSNVTFSGNSATNDGGAMYNDGTQGTSNPSVSNVIAWGNTAVNGPEIYNDSATPTIDHSVIQGSGGSASWDTSLGDDSGGNLNTDPLLGLLQDNGGPTQTLLPDAGSSAIDAGDSSTCLAVDQRGVSRPQGAACDIGAVEVEQYVLSVTVTGSGSVSAGASPAPVIGGIAGCTATGSASCTAGYAPNANVTLSASADVGQHFVSWSGDCSTSAASTSVSMDGDKTCSANFASNTHNVGGTVSGLAGSGLVLQVNGGGDLSITGNGSFAFVTPLDYGTTYSVTVLTQPTSPAQNCSVSNASGSMPDADVTNVAVSCATNTHTVTATVGSGNGNITPASQSVNDGDTASLTVTAATGWHIDTVTGCGGTLSASTYTTAAISADCSVTASFAIDAFAVNTAISGGYGTISPTSITSDYGATPSFTLTPDPHYHISSVTGCGGTLNGNSYTTAPITGPCTITAAFAQTIAPYVAVPTLDRRLLLLLASLLGGFAAVRLRRG